MTNMKKNIIGACEYESTTSDRLLLDSSLIVATRNREIYDLKLISCGDYIQVYKQENKKVKNVKKDIKTINTDSLRKIENKKIESNNIELKNIIRSKLACQRIAKANAKDWKTFITLTFEENILNIDKANKKLKNFIDSVRRIYKDFKYICIPEFQKRGAVHYHMLTNIDINNDKLIYKQEDNQKYKHVKYWNNGFTKVDNLNNDIKKIIGYISKYMTKDIDNRLYNRHRYLYSKNLQTPKVSYLNLDNPKHLEFYKKMIKNKQLIYSNKYTNSYNDDLIEFEEFL